MWKEQLGLAGPDVISYGVATNNLGNVFITGETNGNLTEQNHGKFDAWLAKYTQ